MQPHELMDLSHKATDRFKQLLETGITDTEALLATIQLEMPPGILLVDASSPSNPFILAREAV